MDLHLPFFELGKSLNDNPAVHFQHFERVADSIVLNDVLCLCSRQGYVAKLEQGGDIPVGDLCRRVALVLQLAKALGG